MAAIFQMTSWNGFSLMKIFELRFFSIVRVWVLAVVFLLWIYILITNILILQILILSSNTCHILFCVPCWHVLITFPWDSTSALIRFRLKRNDYGYFPTENRKFVTEPNCDHYFAAQVTTEDKLRHMATILLHWGLATVTYHVSEPMLTSCQMGP